jgi:hypothetical protein
MTLSLNVRRNGREINLPASRAQKALAVSNEFTVVLGADAIAYSIVTKYLRQRQFTSILIDRPKEPTRIVVGQAILDALGQYPFSSIQELAGLTCIPATTVHRHLMQSLGFAVKHLRWAPHTLTPTQKTERTTLSTEILRHLRSIEHDGWQFTTTLDDSWFYLSIGHEQIGLRAEEQYAERPRYAI